MTLLRSTSDAPVVALSVAYALATALVMAAGFAAVPGLAHTPRCVVTAQVRP